MRSLSQHTFVTPPELRGITRSYPVVIVGAGPVGLALAASLARLDIECVVVERNYSAGEGSRAICLSRRSLEILDSIGAAGAFVDKGLGWTQGRSFYRDSQIHVLSMSHNADEKFLPMTNLQQYYMEQFLAEHCARQASIDVRRGTALVEIEQEPDHVVAIVSTPHGNYRLPCSYLIAADGARSHVRKLLGLSLEGNSFAGRYLIADIHLSSTYPTERRAWFDPPSNPGSTVLMHKQPDDVWRIDFQLPDNKDEGEQLAPDAVRARVQRHLDFIGESRDWDLVWKSTYRAHALALPRYDQGRVLFAGDAAHLVPIFGVRGLNSGFADVQNLAWKLAWTLRGAAGDRLLPTYSLERRAATMEILRQTQKTTRFVTPGTRGESIMRDAVLELSLKYEFARSLVDPRQSVPFAYLDTPLNTPPLSRAGNAFASGPPPGAPLPNMRVTSGTRACHLLDWLGSGFTAIFFIPRELEPPERNLLGELLEHRDLRWLIVVSNPAGHIEVGRGPIVLDDTAGGAERLFGAETATLYLVRPDGHVCARWKRVDSREFGKAVRRACAI